MIQPVLLFSDAAFFVLLLVVGVALWRARHQDHLRTAMAKIAASRSGMAAATLLAFFLLIALCDSLHYRLRLAEVPGQETRYAVEVTSVLDAVLRHVNPGTERTYSAPLATHLYVKEARENGERDYPRLRFGGAHISDGAAHASDVAQRLAAGLAAGFLFWLVVLGLSRSLCRRWPQVAWWSVGVTLLAVFLLAGSTLALASAYHVLGTDKVGQDVLVLALKSVRTGILIGTLTTLAMLPFAVALGLVAGYVGGWVDDLVQYIYTVLNSIPGVLLIAAAVLMMQALIDTHPEWFSTGAQRADARLMALCLILGITSWTSLCRLIRAETLKLREMDYVQAARAFNVPTLRIMARHILPNLMHIILIVTVMDFSGLVLAEAVLSYIGVGVDPATTSFGTMINAARMELAREPAVWWTLAAAFSFMFVLVLAANLLADAVREALDPRTNA